MEAGQEKSRQVCDEFLVLAGYLECGPEKAKRMQKTQERTLQAQTVREK